LLIEAHDQARDALPKDRWLEVKYEDVATRPRDSFESLLAFCELEWDGGFERGFARHAFSTARTDAFRRDLDPADVARLTRSLEHTLSAHAYDSSE
jgi:hypothetical protein